jgi:hypothetical protein
MRETCLLLMLGFPALALLNAWWFGRDLQEFVKQTPTIASTADIERMKGAVGRQMYAALAQIGLLAVGPIAYAVGLVKGALQPGDIVFIILPSAAVLAVAAYYKRIETAAKTIDAADDELRRQRDAIVHTWLKKPFPTW